MPGRSQKVAENGRSAHGRCNFGRTLVRQGGLDLQQTCNITGFVDALHLTTPPERVDAIRALVDKSVLRFTISLRWK